MRWMLCDILADGQQLLPGRQEYRKTRGNRNQRLTTTSHLTTSSFDQICVTCSLLSGVRCWSVHAVGVLLRLTPPQIKSACRPLTTTEQLQQHGTQSKNHPHHTSQESAFLEYGPLSRAGAPLPLSSPGSLVFLSDRITSFPGRRPRKTCKLWCRL